MSEKSSALSFRLKESTKQVIILAEMYVDMFSYINPMEQFEKKNVKMQLKTNFKSSKEWRHLKKNTTRHKIEN